MKCCNLASYAINRYNFPTVLIWWVLRESTLYEVDSQANIFVEWPHQDQGVSGYEALLHTRYV